MGQEDQTPDTGAGKSASFLDEDQGADIDGHLPDMDETVAEAIPPFFREPDAGRDERLGSEQFPGESHLPFPLQIETGRPDLSGDLPGQINGPTVFRIRQPFYLLSHPLYSSGMPQRRFAAACFSFMFTPRAIMTRCACGDPAPCIDSVR